MRQNAGPQLSSFDMLLSCFVPYVCFCCFPQTCDHSLYKVATGV
ncbi:rCG28863, isoform CRA_a, partial [Rattus norvegicus]